MASSNLTLCSIERPLQPCYEGIVSDQYQKLGLKKLYLLTLDLRCVALGTFFSHTNVTKAKTGLLKTYALALAVYCCIGQNGPNDYVWFPETRRSPLKIRNQPERAWLLQLDALSLVWEFLRTPPDASQPGRKVKKKEQGKKGDIREHANKSCDSFQGYAESWEQ